MLDIITIGSATRDVFLLSDHFEILNSPASSTGAYECVPLGSKVEVQKIVHTTGGGATNAAATFASLGFRTGIVSRVGQDDAGGDILHELRAYGIKTSLVRQVQQGQTAYSTLLTTKSGERTVLVYRGVSSTFTDADIHWRKCNARYFYLTSLGGNLPLCRKIIAHAARRHQSVCWNPGKEELKAGLRVFKQLLSHVAVLNMNREEAGQLTGEKTIKNMLAKLSTDNNVVIITDGSAGAYAKQGKITLHAKTTGKKSISRTGAGDAFGSGFVAAWMKNHDLHYALATGTLNAESVIQHMGAKLGIIRKWPSEAEIKKIKISRS